MLRYTIKHEFFRTIWTTLIISRSFPRKQHPCINLALIQKKKWVKNFFLGFSWKFLHNLILIWRIQNLISFFQFFSSSSSFLPQLVKNVLKDGSKIFLGFSWKLPHNLILIWKIQKVDSFSHIFSSSSSSLPRLVKMS